MMRGSGVRPLPTLKAPARPPLLALLALLAIGPAGSALAQPRFEEPVGGVIPEDARAALRAALYEEVPLLGDKALAPRPATLARAVLQDVAQRFPQVAAVHKYLGRAAYQAGDPAAAEKAYQMAVSVAGPADAPWALEELAAFYRERNQAREELATLDREVTALLAGPRTGELKTRLRELYERERDLAEAHALAGAPARYARKIIELYPEDPSYLRRYIDDLVARGRTKEALAEVARYRPRFTALGEVRYFAQIEAGIAEQARDADRAEAVYRRLIAADPLAAAGDDGGLYRDYFDLVKRLGRDRETKRALLAKARAGTIAGGDLALLVELHVYEGDSGKARELLTELATKPAPAAELALRGRLYLLLRLPERAVPLLYAAYRAAGTAQECELALGELGLALVGEDLGRTGLTPLAPLGGFRLRHVASGPSIAGGLASLLFNRLEGEPAKDLDHVQAVRGNQERAEVVLAELKRLAPRSLRTAALMAALVDSARAYHEWAEAARLAEEFGRAFPQHPRYVAVRLSGCDARWRRERPAGVACYQGLLDEAYGRREHTGYDEVLSAFASAWAGERRGQAEVLKLYWAEIGKHPDDAALYDRFLEHLGRHNLFDEELRVYEQGLKRFATSSWYDRIARWHLERRGAAAFQTVTWSLIGDLDDAKLAAYLESLVNYNPRSATADASRFYEAIYKKALERFPYDPRFVGKLLAFYDRFPKQFAPAGQRLVRRYLLADPDLLARFLRDRAAAGKLEADLALVNAGGNVAERALGAAALVFLSRQEMAVPILGRLIEDFPADRALVRRHAALVRAVADPDRRTAATRAAGLLERLVTLYPADESLLTEVGDYYAESGQLEEAGKRYERIIALAPGDLDAYLRLASIRWDFFQFDAAAEVIRRARKRSGDPLKFADKLGAIYESKKDFSKAIAEYIRLAAGAERLDEAQPPASGEGEGTSELEEEGGEGGDAGAQVDAGGDAGLSRLVYLARRRGMNDAVARAWRTALGASAKGAAVDLGAADGRTVLANAAYLARLDRPEERRKLLGEAAAKARDPRLLARIVELVRGDESARPVLVAALARQAELGKGAPAYVYPLVDALVAGHEDARAEQELRGLIERLDKGGEDDRDEAVAARVTLADLLWQRRRRPEAIGLRAEAAAQASGARKEELALEVIAWRIAEKQLDLAESEARAFLGQHPGEARWVRPVADVLLARGQREEALQLYQEAIQTTRKLTLAEGERRRRGIELRHALIDLLRRMPPAGRHREAVDQWIEIVNANPSDESEIMALHEYAVAQKQLGRVVEYYTKTAHTASRDVRWPLVLATLADLEGDPATAAARLRDALAIAPERTGLWQSRAEALLRVGDPVQAAQSWHRLWELADHDPRWAMAEARALGRAGKTQEALKILRGVVAAAAESGTTGDRLGPWWDAAALLEDAGLVSEAWTLATEGVDRIAKRLGETPWRPREAATYARIAVRSGHAAEALGKLFEIRQQAHTLAEAEGTEDPWRARSTGQAAHQALTEELPHAVAEIASDREARRFAEALVARGAKSDGDTLDLWAEIASAAGRPDVTRALWRRGTRLGDEAGPRYVTRLVQSLAEAHLYDELVELLGDAKGPAPSPLRPADLLTLAEAERALGDSSGESQALARYLAARASESEGEGPRFGGRDAALDRYLTLLLARKADAELRQQAERGGAYAPQIADFLFAHGRPDLGQVALGALGHDEGPVWRDAKQGEALLALGGHGKEAATALGRVLGGSAAIAPIGEVLAHRPDAGAPSQASDQRSSPQLTGERWYRYATRYAEALRQARDPRAARLAAASVEARPRDSMAYVEHGDALLRLGDRRAAVAAYQRGLSLKTGDRRALDHLARAYLAAGDRGQALATWDRLVARKDARAADHRARFELVLAAGLDGEARATYARYLASIWTQASSERLGDLRALGRAYPSHAAGSEWEKFLRGLLDKGSWRDLALVTALAGLGASDEEGLVDAAAREPYLRAGIGLTAGEEQLRWRQALAEWGLGERHYDAVLFAIAPVIEAARPQTHDQTEQEAQKVPSWAALARARARFGKGERGPAVEELVAWVHDQGDAEHQSVAALLAELKSPAEWQVRLEQYQARLAQPGRAAVDEVGLGEALWHLGRKDEAIAALRRAVVRRLDDHDTYRLAAESAEKATYLEFARDLRRRLALLAPLDGGNRAALARDEWRTGSNDRALALAGTLLRDERVSAMARRQAADLLGEMARAGVRAARDTVARTAEAAGSGGASGPEEPLLLARAQAGGDLDTGLLKGSIDPLAAPRTTLLRLAEAATRTGQAAEAARYYRRLRALGSEEPRRAQVQAERAAGRPFAALLLLDSERLRDWSDAWESEGASDEALGRRLAQLARDEAGQPPWKELETQDDRRMLAETAVEAARAVSSVDQGQHLAFYTALAARVAPSHAAEQRAAEALRATLDAHRTYMRRFVTPDLDHLLALEAIP
ncbi:MAG TPA: tetratricopeptide repeat protein [Polyangia bacterium]|nr:tetratricopeptide repeat protein [Polyangia bacterium]